MLSENKKPTHLCIVIGHDMDTIHSDAALAKKIEAAYAELNQDALKNNMVILGTFQQAVTVERAIYVIITVQWVSRLDLQEAQMRDMISGQMPKA